MIRAYGDQIRNKVRDAQQRAEELCPTILKEADQHGSQLLQEEIHRLHALQQVNPNVREDEITFFAEQLDALKGSLAASKPRLDALRVIVTL